MRRLRNWAQKKSRVYDFVWRPVYDGVHSRTFDQVPDRVGALLNEAAIPEFAEAGIRVFRRVCDRLQVSR